VGVETLDRLQAAERCVEQLGLDPNAVELTSAEALAAALRRAASFLCPTGPARLLSAVERTVLELVDAGDGFREQLGNVLETMVGYGDLLELPARDDAQAPSQQLYLGPPAFVRRASGSFLLLGIRPEASPLVGEELAASVEYERHVRRIAPGSNLELEDLLAAGLHEIPTETWLRAPRRADPLNVIKEYDAQLSVAAPSGQIEGLRIVDPEASVRYYRGRWRPPAPRDNGRFVARRPQAFGADLWCYVELADGSTTRLIDLPLSPDLFRGCDEAWRLQAAIDAARGSPQVLRLRKAQRTSMGDIVDLFAPIPRWLQRRWDALATPTRSKGALFSYSFAHEETDEEVEVGRPNAVDAACRRRRNECQLGMPTQTPTIAETIEDIREALRDYIEATYHVGSPGLVRRRKRLLDRPGVIFQAPYIESTPRYTAAAPFADLRLPEAARELLDLMAHPAAGESALLYDPPYRHQARALELALGDDRSLVITTGTGSGKTESFLLPVLGKLALEAKERPTSFAIPAVRAILLYPMNALVNDQPGAAPAHVRGPSSRRVVY
jgi:hypothetical protein